MGNYDWLVKQMEAAHAEGRIEDRNNYAKMADIDVVKWFYMSEVSA